jgi:hypothetical protein
MVEQMLTFFLGWLSGVITMILIGLWIGRSLGGQAFDETEFDDIDEHLSTKRDFKVHNNISPWDCGQCGHHNPPSNIPWCVNCLAPYDSYRNDA